MENEYVAKIVSDAILEKLDQEEARIDDQIRRLEQMDDDDLEQLRARRLEAMRKQEQKQREFQAKGHGSYREITDQRQFFEELKQSERAVCHFFRDTTERCRIVDRHLERLAARHMETKFIKVNAEKSPFLCERLNIWMIPTIVLVKSGKTEHSIIGFDEMGGTDDFPTSALARVIASWGVIQADSDQYDGSDEETSKRLHPRRSNIRQNQDSDSDIDT